MSNKITNIQDRDPATSNGVVSKLDPKKHYLTVDTKDNPATGFQSQLGKYLSMTSPTKPGEAMYKVVDHKANGIYLDSLDTTLLECDPADAKFLQAKAEAEARAMVGSSSMRGESVTQGPENLFMNMKPQIPIEYTELGIEPR